MIGVGATLSPRHFFYYMVGYHPTLILVATVWLRLIGINFF